MIKQRVLLILLVGFFFTACARKDLKYFEVVEVENKTKKTASFAFCAYDHPGETFHMTVEADFKLRQTLKEGVNPRKGLSLDTDFRTEEYIPKKIQLTTGYRYLYRLCLLTDKQDREFYELIGIDESCSQANQEVIEDCP